MRFQPTQRFARCRIGVAILGVLCAVSATAEPVFDERAAELGLDFVHRNGMRGEYFFSEMMGPGVALADVDGDGDLDVYLVQGGPLASRSSAQLPTDRLFRNDLIETGQLAFTDVTVAAGLTLATEYGMGVAAGDFDDDGRVDLYLTNFGRNQLLRNEGIDDRGQVRFRDVTDEAGAGDRRWSVSASFSDLDRDGRLDLFVANYVDYALAIHKPCRNYTGAPDYCSPLAYGPEPDRLLRNVGGRFERATESAGLAKTFGAGLGVVAADLDDNGWTDLYVANDQSANQMWMNQGESAGSGPRFADESLLGGTGVNAEGRPEAGMGVAAGDPDGDGDVDLLVSHLVRETHTLYLNQGGGFFDDRTQDSGLAQASWDATGFGAVWLDFDSDGNLDLAVANGAVKHLEHLLRAGDPFPLHQPNQLFRNLGAQPAGPRFEDVTPRAGEAWALSEVSRGLAVGDVDNDGDPDLLVGNNNGPVRLLLNRTPRSGAWLGLRLLESSGRDALGAHVRIDREGSRAIRRTVRTDGSYASASDPRILVTLGTGEVTRIEVTWADGTRESFSSSMVKPGVYTTLRRGSGGAKTAE
ncbi:MAG: CRTAC1 family protein [Thermoanaerobaculia bacterium]|nr:CRTAC1 family protein [Thermoanaerobaculia bacterium]